MAGRQHATIEMTAARLPHRWRRGTAYIFGKRATPGEGAARRQGEQRRHGTRNTLQPLALAARGGNRSEQAARIGMLWRAQHILYRAGFDQFAGIHHRDLVHALRNDAEVVADENERHAEFLAKLGEQMKDAGLHGHVKRRGRLVRDQEIGRVHQHHRNHYALAEAARKFVRILCKPVGRIRHADPVEQIDRAFASFFRPGSAVHRHGFDQLPPDGVDRVQRSHRLLKDHRHAARGDGFRELDPVHREQIMLAEAQHRSLADCILRQEVHQRQRSHRLAAAGFADDAERLAPLQREAHAAHGVQITLAHRQGDGEIADLEKRRLRCAHRIIFRFLR